MSEYETSGEFDTGRAKRKPAARPNSNAHPMPNKGRRLGLGQAGKIQVTARGEERAGLMLASPVKAGNEIINTFGSQTTAQHDFICTAVKVNVFVANDPALTNQPDAFAVWENPPAIRGRNIMDGKMTVAGNKSVILHLAQPMRLRELSSLSPGSANLVGGTPAMKWSLGFHYMTELDVRSGN